MGIFWEKKNKEDGKKSRFLHEINEIPNEGGLYYVLSSIQFKYKILTNKIRLDCGTVLRSGRFLTHRHVSC